MSPLVAGVLGHRASGAVFGPRTPGGFVMCLCILTDESSQDLDEALAVRLAATEVP